MAVVSVPVRTYRSGAGRIGSAGLFLALVAAAPAILGLARLLPAHGPALALRLTAAAACVLLVPGGIFVRALGRPAAFGVALAASFVWSLAALAGALALTFAFDGTIDTTLWLLAGFSAVALVPALMRAPLASEPTERRAVAGVAAGGAVFAGAVWWTASSIYGDGLFHLGRIRKLEAFDLTSINVVDEFKHGGLHPGYAFPVWHSAVALVARIADVDPALALLHLPAILTPLAVVLAYAAGAALFRSFGGGIATAAAQVGLLGFSRAGTGSFDSLALPATVARALIAPALLALVFSFAAGGRRRGVLSIAAASLALALVHPTYAFFVAVPLVGLPGCARRAGNEPLARGCARRRRTARGALAGRSLRALVEADRGSDRLAPARCGGARPHDRSLLGADRRDRRLAASRARRRSQAAARSPSPACSRSRSQLWRGRAAGLRTCSAARSPFSVCCSSRGRSTSCQTPSRSRSRVASRPSCPSRSRWQARRPCSAVSGSPAAWPRSASAASCSSPIRASSRTRVVVGGPSWPVWVALGGAAVGLVVAAVAPQRARRGRAGLDGGGRALLVAPVGLAGIGYLKQDEPDRLRLTPGLVAALRTDVRPRDVVFSDLETSYRIAGYAPVYVSAAPPAHVADTKENNPMERREDVIDFLGSGSLAIPRRYHADWIVVAKHRFRLDLPLPKAYEDRRFVLYRLSSVIVNANNARPTFSCSSSASASSTYEPLGKSPVSSSCAR